MSYRKLSPKQREAFDQATPEALAYGDELSAKSEEALLGKLKEPVMQLTKPSSRAIHGKGKAGDRQAAPPSCHCE